MEHKQTIYVPPQTETQLPAAVVELLDGEHLEARSGEAIRLSTVGEDGWPHAAQLSVGEVLVLSPTDLLVAIWPGSHTAGQMRRDGRVTLSLALDGALVEIRARATFKAEPVSASRLAVFAAASIA